MGHLRNLRNLRLQFSLLLFLQVDPTRNRENGKPPMSPITQMAYPAIT
jgi:hypothetical protein